MVSDRLGRAASHAPVPTPAIGPSPRVAWTAGCDPETRGEGARHVDVKAALERTVDDDLWILGPDGDAQDARGADPIERLLLELTLAFDECSGDEGATDQGSGQSNNGRDQEQAARDTRTICPARRPAGPRDSRPAFRPEAELADEVLVQAVEEGRIGRGRIGDPAEALEPSSVMHRRTPRRSPGSRRDRG